MERSAADVWQLESGVQALSRLGEGRRFQTHLDDPGLDFAMVDGTTFKVRRHTLGANGGPRNQAIGKSKGGWTAKILALTDALGNLVLASCP